MPSSIDLVWLYGTLNMTPRSDVTSAVHGNRFDDKVDAVSSESELQLVEVLDFVDSMPNSGSLDHFDAVVK